MRNRFLLVLLAFVCGANLAPLPLAHALEAGETATEKLTLVAGGVAHALQVEVARSPESRERGLMYRRHLPEDRGMIFDFGHEQTVLMWMKNTYIPLDMIFISRDGRVTHIETNTEPLSEAIISSNGPAYAVLEVNAGFSQKIGLKVGDKVEHALFAR